MQTHKFPSEMHLEKYKHIYGTSDLRLFEPIILVWTCQVWNISEKALQWCAALARSVNIRLPL